MKLLKTLTFCLLIGGAPGLEGAPPPETPAPTNLLLLTADTLRRDHLSAYGYPYQTSPTIDRLAREGVQFDRAYAPISVTGPAHATLMTGRYPHSHGAFRNGIPIADSAVTLAEVLKRHGWATGAFVSGWTLRSKLTHLDRGFDVYDETFGDRYRGLNSRRFANDVIVPAKQWIKDRGAGPYFAWVHFFDPHAPYRPRPEFHELPLAPGVDPEAAPGKDRRSKKMVEYDSEIAFMDFYIARLLEGLDLSRTLVLFVADHGESFGEHGVNGHGRHVDEAQVRVPLIFHYPPLLPAGARADAPVLLTDVAPTLLELFGVTDPFPAQGVSLTGLLRGDGAPPAPRRLYLGAYHGAVGHVPRFLRKLFFSRDPKQPIRMGFIEYPWKYVYDSVKGGQALYHLETDPQERENVFASQPDFATARTQWREWYQSTKIRLEDIRLSKEDRKHLKSLGYVQ